jgi:hypothetical protein
MATETETEAGGMDPHFRSVTVTSLAALVGIAAAVVSSMLTGDLAPAAAATNGTAQAVVVAAIALQLPLLRVTGLMKEDFGAKDLLFIALVTFSMWFITWGILLTSGASF